MLRNSSIGLVTFGLLAAIAGYAWTAYEFPFAILLPAVVGFYAVVRSGFGNRTALWAALVGGVTFAAAFIVALFFALTDGSPFALTAWMSATLAAAAAGATTGWLLDRTHGSITLAAYSAAGMLVATLLAGLIRSLAPGSVDAEGPTQFAYVALMLGVVGGVLGVALGAGVAWLEVHHGARGVSAGARPGMPHQARGDKPDA
jgi:hypothetical protein